MTKRLSLQIKMIIEVLYSLELKQSEWKILVLFLIVQHFVEELSNHTGYTVSKLVDKKIWRVYDTLTCQVYLIFHSEHKAHINTINHMYYLLSAVRRFHLLITVQTKAAVKQRQTRAMERRGFFFLQHICREMWRQWGGEVIFIHTVRHE